MTPGDAVLVGRVETGVHGRFLVRPASSVEGPLLVGFHGYGESASSIMEALLAIPGVEVWHVAAIQALHPFYNRATGEVVASWMTKQDRELAIADNLAYVGRALAAISRQLQVSGRRVYAGFSQGTAMTYRAAAAAGEGCDGIVALAGDVPPELAEAKGWGRAPVLIGRGTKDRWYDEAQNERDVRLLEALGSRVDTVLFRGGHEWTDAFRRRVTGFLDVIHG